MVNWFVAVAVSFDCAPLCSSTHIIKIPSVSINYIVTFLKKYNSNFSNAGTLSKTMKYGQFLVNLYRKLQIS